MLVILRMEKPSLKYKDQWSERIACYVWSKIRQYWIGRKKYVNLSCLLEEKTETHWFFSCKINVSYMKWILSFSFFFWSVMCWVFQGWETLLSALGWGLMGINDICKNVCFWKGKLHYKCYIYIHYNATMPYKRESVYGQCICHHLSLWWMLWIVVIHSFLKGTACTFFYSFPFLWICET